MLQTSVLILHYNKNYELSLILESFCRQTASKDTFEIVIIDDGSDNPPNNEVKNFINKGLNIRLLELQHSGNRALCRSTAVKNAAGENIIFLDSDMIPSFNFIERHNKNINSGEKKVSLGLRHLLYDFQHEKITTNTIDDRFDILENMPCVLDERETFIYAHKKLGIDTSQAWFIGYSHNIGLKKQLYLSVQGFDQNFRFGWGVEDVEFSFQLYSEGATFIYDSNIVCYHVCHKGSFNIDLYNKNLTYFFDKYLSYEPELFMTQHLQNPVVMSKLYYNVREGKYLSEIKKDEIKKHEECLFVGFSNTDNSINANQNKLISTNDQNAEYKLIGRKLPYKTKTFKQVIISKNYDLFPLDFLFTIIKELYRVGLNVYIQKDEGVEGIEQYWREKTGFTFSDFIRIGKIRIMMTPSSIKRQNNVLFVELAKALDRNGFYVSLELAFDEFKDNFDIYPLVAYDKDLIKLYSREFRFYSEPILSIMDCRNNNFVYLYNQIQLWWGDISLYGQNEKADEDNFFKLKITRDKNDSISLIPGIYSQKINRFLKKNVSGYKSGIVIIDLYLENLETIKEILDRFAVVSSFVPITIITLPVMLDENKIYKNSNLHSLNYMNKKQKKSINEVQELFLKRITELINICSVMKNVSIHHSTGDLKEIDSFLTDNSDFLDLSNTRDFNPYVLEAAAYGLRVYTVSDLYNQYNYKNIFQIRYKNINGILETDAFWDKYMNIKPEIYTYRRMIDIQNLVVKYTENINFLPNFDEIKMLNAQYDWKETLNTFQNKILK